MIEKENIQLFIEVAHRHLAHHFVKFKALKESGLTTITEFDYREDVYTCRISENVVSFLPDSIFELYANIHILSPSGNIYRLFLQKQLTENTFQFKVFPESIILPEIHEDIKCLYLSNYFDSHGVITTVYKSYLKSTPEEQVEFDTEYKSFLEKC